MRAFNVSLSRALPIVATVLVASCKGATDGPTSAGAPPTASLTVVVVNGSSQRGFPGDLLDAPIGVQIVDAAGHPVATRRRIRFAIVSGGGSVSDTSLLSADDGRASISWWLGAAVGPQQLAASVVDGVAGSATPVFAEAVSPSEADLVVLRGLTQGNAGILVRQDNSTWTYTLTWPDTILRLLPREPVNNSFTQAWQEVTAFSVGHPPATALQPWTTRPDTVNLVLRPPIAVPFTVWVGYDFDTTAARARWDLGNVDAFWRTHMTGLRVGTIRIESAPGLAVQCATPPAPFDLKAINVYYPATLAVSATCDASTILMLPTTVWSFTPIAQMNLPRAVGSALALDYVADETSFMNGNGVAGGNITIGQIYWMHFHYSSALNAVLSIHPVAERNCNLPFSSHCPAQTFNVW